MNIKIMDHSENDHLSCRIIFTVHSYEFNDHQIYEILGKEAWPPNASNDKAVNSRGFSGRYFLSTDNFVQSDYISDHVAYVVKAIKNSKSIESLCFNTSSKVSIGIYVHSVEQHSVSILFNSEMLRELCLPNIQIDINAVYYGDDDD